MIRPEPAVRSDGRCVECKGRRGDKLPKVITQRSRAELIRNLEADPFCSNVCCREYHGASMPEPNIAGEFGVAA